LVTPATWKSFIKKRYGLNDMLKLLEKPKLTPHMADATGMAIYYAEKYCEQEKVLEHLKNTQWSCEANDGVKHFNVS
jgi:hypothetical protein